MHGRKNRQLESVEKYNQALANLKSLYEVNSELKFIKDSFGCELLLITIQGLYLQYLRMINPVVLVKFHYDIYKTQFDKTTDVQQIRELMVNIAKVLSNFIGKERAVALRGVTLFSKMPLSTLLNLIEKYWAICVEDMGVHYGVSLAPWSNQVSLWSEWITPKNLEDIMQAYTMLVGPLGSLSMVCIMQRYSSAALKKRMQEEMTDNLTYKNIIKLSDKLECENFKLRQHTKRNKNLIYLLYVVIFIPVVIYSFFNGELAPELAMIGASLFLPLLLDFLHGIKNSRKVKEIKSKLLDAEDFLANSIPLHLVSSRSVDQGACLKSSFIHLRFCRFEDIAPTKVGYMIKSVLFRHGLPITDHNKVSLSICADFSISAYKKNIIKEEIHQVIKRFQQSHLLTQQLEEICFYLDFPGTSIPQSINGLSSIRFLIKINQSMEQFDQSFIDRFLVRLRNLFSNNIIEMHAYHISITGFIPCEEQLLKKMISDCKENIKLIKEKKGFFTQQSMNHNFIYKKPLYFKKEEQKDLRASSITIEPCKIETNRVGKINPLVGKGIPFCFFTLFTLKREDFGIYAGTKEKPGSYDKFAAMAADSHLAPGRKGATGFIFIDRMVRDKNGNFFHAKGMFKAKGSHGNERVFCSEEIIDDKVVYVARAFDPKAHS
ncbi:MAG: hypothetical protein KIT56_06355 [Gammaproteobacteria bacterium]|nr:hypothetical protein [Gammaproteobacteria bacterium]MCW5583487.1 hypothetical protein [Gammaproteobacteria bacterium]